MLSAIEVTAGDHQSFSHIQDQHADVVVTAERGDDSKALFFAPSVLMVGELLCNALTACALDDPTSPTLKVVGPLFVADLESDRCIALEGQAGHDASLAGQLLLYFGDTAFVFEGIVTDFQNPREDLFIG